MSTTQSMDDAEAECRKLMGDPLGVVFSRLHVKLVELHIVWQQYRQLFGEGEETVNLLNRTAGLFFKIVQDDLWDSVLLGICRMTDPAVTRDKKTNLTIWSLPDLVDDPGLQSNLALLCEEARKEAGLAREHRHKRIAHQDFGYAHDRAAHPISGISRENVEHMLKALRAVLNRMNGHYKDSECLYERFIDDSGARLLVLKLQKLERLSAGASPNRPPIQ